MSGSKRISLEAVCDSLSEGVVAVDREMRILSMNSAAARFAGVAREDAIGRGCDEVLGRGECGSDCALRETLRTGEPVRDRPACLACRSEQRMPVEVTTSLLRSDDGEVIGGVVTLRDMSLVERLRRDLERRFNRGDIVSRSARMGRLLEILPAVARSGSTVLIQGESGTGKELIARAIHEESERRDGPFVVVNCGALPAPLIESELFGHERGAFTDARERKPGQAALAAGGTLFLDEVGELEPSVQVKLLRLLQERTFLPLGGTEPVRADIRFVAATNRDLARRVEEGAFREDLFYRLNVVPLALPPLRDRREDIPLLVAQFVERFNAARGKSIEGISRDALRLLMTHPLPGNVRQLENAVEYAFVLCPCGTIEVEHLPPEIAGSRVVPVIEVADEMSELEALFILAALKRNAWSRKATADDLGIHPSTLYRKIRTLGIRTPADGRSRSRPG